jgi:hypothetical protein
MTGIFSSKISLAARKKILRIGEDCVFEARKSLSAYLWSPERPGDTAFAAEMCNMLIFNIFLFSPAKRSFLLKF